MFVSLVSGKAKKIRRLSSRQIDVRFSFLKALGIFFVVYGHVGPGVSLFAEDWFPQGPMKLPLFIFVSGFFYSLANDDAPVHFLIKRAKRLLVPYFIWNIIYGLLASLLRGIGLIRFGSPVTPETVFLTPWINGHQFQFNIAAWFLPALFLVCAVFSLFRFCLKKLHILNEWCLLAVLFAVSYAAVRFSQAGANHGGWLPLLRTAYFLPFFQMGVVCRTKCDGVKVPALPFMAVVVAASAANIAILKPTGAITVWCSFTGSAAGHLISVVLAILFWYKIADLLSPALEKLTALRYLGENTFTVMMHHAVVIFLINTALYLISGPLSIGSFNVEQYRSTVWYSVPLFGRKFLLFYILAGIILPCIGKYICDRAALRLDRRLSLKKTDQEVCHE